MNTQEDSSVVERPDQAAPQKSSPWPPAIAGLLAIVAGPFIYAGMMEVPWIRSTGLPAFGLMAVGLFLSFVAIQRRRGLAVKIVAGLNLAFVLLFAFGFFVMAAVPQSDEFVNLKKAPEFALKSETGQTVTLAEARTKGPVLLVFYRGFW